MERSAQAQWCIPGWGRATYIYIHILFIFRYIYIYLYLYSASFYQKYIYQNNIYIYIYIAYLDLTVLENLYLFKPAILRSSKYGFKEITRGLLSGFVFEL